MPAIGESITRLRKENGMTQEELAAMLGVSAQTISKWENQVTMPDILLLPIIADTFGVTIDALFRPGNAQQRISPDEAFEAACQSLLSVIASACFRGMPEDEPFEKFLERYVAVLKEDPIHRTAVIYPLGVLYYRDPVGGLLLKRPADGWSSLLESGSEGILRLLSDPLFCKALQTVLEGKLTVFTVPFLCRQCGIQDEETLEKALCDSGLFVSKEVAIDDKTLTVYELLTNRLFLLFVILACAKEYTEFQDVYINYHGDVHFYAES